MLQAHQLYDVIQFWSFSIYFIMSWGLLMFIIFSYPVWSLGSFFSWNMCYFLNIECLQMNFYETETSPLLYNWTTLYKYVSIKNGCLFLIINLNTSLYLIYTYNISLSLSVTCLCFLSNFFKEQPFFNTDEVQLYFVHLLL